MWKLFCLSDSVGPWTKFNYWLKPLLQDISRINYCIVFLLHIYVTTLLYMESVALISNCQALFLIYSWHGCWSFFRALCCSWAAVPLPPNMRGVQNVAPLIRHLSCRPQWSGHWRTGQDKHKGSCPTVASHALILLLQHVCKQKSTVLCGTQLVFFRVWEGTEMKPRDRGELAQRSVWRCMALRELTLFS